MKTAGEGFFASNAINFSTKRRPPATKVTGGLSYGNESEDVKIVAMLFK